MKKLIKKNLYELSQVMPVISKNEQNSLIGGLGFMKNILISFCFIMFSIGIYGQNLSSDDLSLLKKTPEISSLYNSALHYVLLYENDVDSLTKALTYIDRAIVINPNISYSYLLKGEILFRIGKKEESLKLFSSLCKKEYCTYNTLFFTGILYEKTGFSQKAFEYYDRALDKNTKVLKSAECNLKDFIYNIVIRYFIDGKKMDIDEVKSLLPDHLKNTNDKIIQTEVDDLYKNFDKDNYINNLWNHNIQ